MKTRLPLLLLATLAWSEVARAENGGIRGYSGNPATNAGQSCGKCHDGGQTTTVNLSGPMTVTPGSTNTYTLTIAGSATRQFGGLDVSATLGMLAAFEAGTQRQVDEIVHTTRKAAVNNEVTFNFNWTAPANTATATLYAAGLSTDGPGTGGDALGRMALMISVESPPTVNQPPVAVPGAPYAGTAGASIAFDGSGSYDPDGTIVAYAWDFGDNMAGSGALASHAYASPGNYTVTLTVTDDGGATGTATTVANVNPVPPQVNQPPIAVAGGPYTGIVGTSIAFDGSGSSDPDGSIASYAWSFGDGSTGSGASSAHSYVSAGVYKVTLTVTDNQGASSSNTTDATVRDASEPSLYAVLQAPRSVAVGTEGSKVKIQVKVDLSSLPAGTTGCGTATLFKNEQRIGSEFICIERRQDDDDDDDEEEENARSRQERKTLRLKTRDGVVALSRPWQGGSARASFELALTLADLPSVVWTARVELAGWIGEAGPVTTRVVEGSRRR
jgi:PKD repeat protein